jgi:hypothetical protein
MHKQTLNIATAKCMFGMFLVFFFLQIIHTPSDISCDEKGIENVLGYT